MVPGIHLLHKPPGPTSFALVRACQTSNPPGAGRRPRRICHGGTLDPFASGLLLILVEPATRLFDHLHAIPKVYRATVQWGSETDNGDPLGKVVATGDPSGLTPAQLDEALASFGGWREQTPHVTSAKRIDGERAYIRAHRGETFNMPAARVYLHEAVWLRHDLPNRSELRLTVRGGYYVRALVRDLGRRLGCFAHLRQLHRTHIGPYADPTPGNNSGSTHENNLGNSPAPNRLLKPGLSDPDHALAYVRAASASEIRNATSETSPSVCTGRMILPWAPTRLLTDQEVGDLRQNRTIPTGEILPPDWALPPGFPDPGAPIRAFHRDRLCFLLTPTAGRLKLLTALPGGL